MARRVAGSRPSPRSPAARRFAVDASVFVNAINPHEQGHAASLQALTRIHERGDPIVVPALLLTEVASALGRATGEASAALDYVEAIVALPNVSIVTMTTTVARQAASLAATHRLRGADAVYVAVALRYGAVLVTRDGEQRTRGAAAVTCQSPEQVVKD